MIRFLSFIIVIFWCSVGLLAQNNTQKKSNDSITDLNSLMELLQDEDLGKTVQSLSQQAEALNQLNPETMDVAEIQKLYEQLGVTGQDDSPNIEQLLQMSQQGANMTPEQKELLSKIIASHRSGKPLTEKDIKFKDADGQTVTMGDMIKESLLQNQTSMLDALSAMQTKFKNMSYSEFREMMMSNPSVKQHPDSERAIKELYNEIQANDGDIFKAVDAIDKREKKKGN